MTRGLGYRGSGCPSGDMVRDALRTDEFIVLPFALQRGPTVGKGAGALAVTLTVPPLPNILFTVGESDSALAVELTVPVLPNILGAAVKGAGALAVRLPTLELPDILRTAGPGVSALAVCPTSKPHVGITRRQSGLSKGWHGQKNEKGEAGTHRLRLTGSSFEHNRL